MKEYRFVLKFDYKSKIYNMYLDLSNKRFFLKEENGHFEYVSLLELLELNFYINSIPFALNAQKSFKHNKIKIIPKVITTSGAVLLTSTIILTALSMYKTQERLKNFAENYPDQSLTYNQNVENYLSSFDSEEKFEIDTYVESDWLKYIYIYDMEYLSKVLDDKVITMSDFEKVINDNNLISDKFKKILYEYCDNLMSKYSNIELRVLYENLKTIEVVECTKEELVKTSLSMDSYGCYIRTENKIYVLEDCKYEKGTWEYQVIFHEFSHCLRTAVWKNGETDIRVQVEGQNFSNTITAEALNSLFTISLFDYNEQNIAYQLQSNYHKVILECIDNYNLSDYVNHSLSYYAKKLDEFNNDDNYATVILELIQFQYDDYHSPSINVSQENYYPIYEYICNMYFKKYINENTTYEEALQITKDLLAKILYDVPEDYNIDENYFYQCLEKYCSSLGIKNQHIKR